MKPHPVGLVFISSINVYESSIISNLEITSGCKLLYTYNSDIILTNHHSIIISHG